LALATKFNAVLMPVIWLVWLLWQRREASVLLRIAVIGALGSGLFVLSWPWLYHDTLNRLAYYVAMGYRFNQTPQYYLGQTGRSPWHYSFVLTAAVLPLGILALGAVGAVKASTDRKDPFGRFVILNMVVPLLVPALGLQAAYSGERHFMPAFACLAMLAGMGFGVLVEVLWEWICALPAFPWKRMASALITPVLAGCLALPPALSIVRFHPYELSYYGELVGGLHGARDLGLETTFWCESYKDCLPYLNEHSPEGALIWVDQPFALRSYQEDGMLREDLRITGWNVVSPYSCDYAVVQMRETGFTDVPELAELVERREPDFATYLHEVPLAMVYRLH
jgi:hypothetical protein